jgi:(S)-3,5-dihydroxyphenylglycine transaminase
MERAENAGFEAIVPIVDAPWLGRRRRDLRNGLRLPPGIEPANLEPSGPGNSGGVARLARFVGSEGG